MNVKQLPFYAASAVVAAGLLSVGCNTPKVVRVNDTIKIKQMAENQIVIQDGVTTQVIDLSEEATGCEVTISEGNIISSGGVTNTVDFSKKDIKLTKEDYKCISVAIVANKKGDGADFVSEKIAKSVKAQILSEGYSVVNAKADVTVSFDTVVSCFDKSGNYYVFDAEISKLSVLKNCDKSVIAAGRIDSKRGERILDKEPALAPIAESLSHEAAAWIDNSLTIDKLGITAATVEFTRTGALAESDSAYIANVVKVLSSIKGVRDCRVIKTDNAKRKFEIKVIYDKLAFPEGLENVVREKSVELDLQ